MPVLTAAAVVGTVLVSSNAYSSPHPKLPARSAAQLLAAVGSSDTVALSGTIVETARLGLPSLPGTDGASLSWQSLVTGSHTAQVWLGGPDRQRIAVKGSLSESDVVHNGRDLWTYTSTTNEVSHSVVPAADAAAPSVTPDALALSPTQAAARVLATIDPTTRVDVDPTRRVAGRKAYTLVLRPKDTRSTVSKVTIALDSAHFVPLQVQIFASGPRPAFETGFTTDLSFVTPKASVFTFRAPAGATVVKDPLTRTAEGERGGVPTPGRSGVDRPAAGAGTGGSGAEVIGKGWTSIVELPHGLPAGTADSLITRFTTPVGTSGARLLSTALVNALILPDGRVFAGAVTPVMLEQTAAATPR